MSFYDPYYSTPEEIKDQEEEEKMKKKASDIADVVADAAAPDQAAAYHASLALLAKKKKATDTRAPYDITTYVESMLAIYKTPPAVAYASLVYAAEAAYYVATETGSTEQEALVAAYEGALAAATYTAAIEAKAQEGLVEPINYEGIVEPPSNEYYLKFYPDKAKSYLESELPEFFTKLNNEETPIDYAEISKAAEASAHSYYTKLAANPIRAEAAKTARAAAEKAIAVLNSRVEV